MKIIYYTDNVYKEFNENSRRIGAVVDSKSHISGVQGSSLGEAGKIMICAVTWQYSI